MVILFNNNSIKTKNSKPTLYINHLVRYMHNGVDTDFLSDYSTRPISAWSAFNDFYDNPYSLDPELEKNIKALEYDRSPPIPMSVDFTIPADVEYTFGELIIPEKEKVENLMNLFIKSPSYLTVTVAQFEMKYHYSLSYDHFVHLLEIMRMEFRLNQLGYHPYLLDNALLRYDDIGIYEMGSETIELAQDSSSEIIYKVILNNPSIMDTPLEVQHIPVLPSLNTPIHLLPFVVSPTIFVSGVVIGLGVAICMVAKESNYMYSPHEFDFIINLNLFTQVIKILCILQIPLWLLIMCKLRYYYYFRFKFILRKLWN